MSEFGIAALMLAAWQFWLIRRLHKRNKIVEQRFGLASCCQQPLSEWFVNKGADGFWGMQCWKCKRVSKHISHQAYREASR